MKTKILTLLITLGIIMLTSCNSDDETSPTVETLNGTWNLTNIIGGFAGIDDDYESGVINWTFNNQIMTLNVENNSTQETIYSGFATGTYSYAIVENDGNEYVLINDEEYGRYVIDVNALVINQNEIQVGVGSDGFILQFER